MPKYRIVYDFGLIAYNVEKPIRIFWIPFLWKWEPIRQFDSEEDAVAWIEKYGDLD